MTPEHKHEFLDEICRGLDGLYPNWNPTMGQQAQWMDCLERKGFDEAVKALKAAYQHPRHNFNKEVPDITIFNQIYSGSSPRGGSAAKQGMVTDTFVQYHGGGHCRCNQVTSRPYIAFSTTKEHEPRRSVRQGICSNGITAGTGA